MGTQNLSRMFNPGSIAVIGADGEQGRVGHTLIRNIVEGGFKGSVYPVNPDHSRIMNLRITSYNVCYTKLLRPTMPPIPIDVAPNSPIDL